MKIIEDAASDREYYYHDENYKCLKKGDEYILFLNRDNAADEYSIISADNGKVCVSDFRDMNDLDETNFGIAVKALVEFDSKLNDEEKAEVIKNKVYRSDDEKSLKKEIELTGGTMRYDRTGKGSAIA